MKPYVIDLIKVIRLATDDRSGLLMSMEFFVNLLRIREEKVPMVEIMTVFRRNRPPLHRIVTKNITEKNPVYFYLDFEGDYQMSLLALGITEEIIRTHPIR
jgi:hypothetical protein